MDNPTAAILIFCAEKFHDDRPFKLATFTRNSEGLWAAMIPSSRRGRPNKGPANRATDILDGDTRLDRVGEVGKAFTNQSEGLRKRWNLRCPCGLHVQARTETLVPYLNKAADTGVSQISLSTLSAIVSRS
ncbi:hypothetical protein ACFQ36_02855 [Arthrobacter sp. GCM10027362]|uniref:hypothetical protein n=1 Tax=Arthrobacter sp. GCM10027362 TaxID=3273379 RepID=UPI003639D79A